MTNGYNFYFATKAISVNYDGSVNGSDVLTFPITPGELTIKSGSNNKVVTLINEGDVNILKSPSLTEISFEARFPMRKYPYSRNPWSFQIYFDTFKMLKEEKKPFRFIVTRAIPSPSVSRTKKQGVTRLWDTNLLVALEEFEIKESADEGDDVLISFQLKQYKEYGVKSLQLPTPPTAPSTEELPTTTSTAEEPRPADNGESNQQKYTVRAGDTLWKIAKAHYGDGSKWGLIYEANKDTIESVANARRNGKGSSNGHWIYVGTELIIPAIK